MKERPVGRRRLVSRIAAGLCLAFALAATLPLFSLVWTVWSRGHDAVTWDFLTSLPTGGWAPGGGIAHAIRGTLIVVGLGTLVGAPVGLLAGIYLSEVGRGRLASAVRTATEALSGVPSIVAGLFGFTLIVLKHGYSGWAASAALGLLMVPVVTRTTEEALRTVPTSMRDASLALGAPQWRTTLLVVIPQAWTSITTGLLLAVARIAGETAPVLLTALTSTFMVTDPKQPMATLPTLIYSYAKSATAKENAQAWGAALVLIGGVLALNLLVRVVNAIRARRA